MSNYNIISHDQEQIIARYCATQNINFDVTSAYDLVMKAFEAKPIERIHIDPKTKEEELIDVTEDVARAVECNNATIERLSQKIDYYKNKQKIDTYEKNIQQAKAQSRPDLHKLLDNLIRLNIADGNGYLAMVCFLMQLKYTRDHEFTNDDKTAVFFNGVPRNGKSATAKAICEIEKAYGAVFHAQSCKIISSTHEEQVWKSHLNCFDEAKPTDLSREDLLNLINGGEVEINPKNKKHYNYNVNTNNIFTSNDQINMLQRRISVIKFGNRLFGRPLNEGTLKGIISDIMDSLPDFHHYSEIYDKVSRNNERAINPLALEHINKYLSTYFSEVKENNPRSLNKSHIFSTTDIYNCIKSSFGKQTISSEVRESIKNALNHFEKIGLLTSCEYENCTTHYYNVDAKGYLQILEKYNVQNTSQEINKKISKEELLDLLRPYFPCPEVTYFPPIKYFDDDKQREYLD